MTALHARHWDHQTAPLPEVCRYDGNDWPCPDVRDLAARYDVEAFA